ncbi:DUF4189 domain-containing protein [Flavobacterium sp. RSB2_4_14]|uniref:DUF4189 domain-containing protein n=1 Tax=Flavobacterium sp. RSB2_4_14 TaxID=3447665 RepID=UPI003F3E1059
MKLGKTVRIAIALLVITTASVAQTAPKYGALAIDRSNGFYYGWAYDQGSLAAAEQRALQECQQRGGDCSVVLAWSGSGCGAYRTIDGNVGTAYGWGLASTKEAADAIATRECLQRSNGKPAVNYVWSCNSATSAPLKELINDKQAPPAPSPVSAPAIDEYINFKGSKLTASGDCPGEGVALITAEDETVMVLFNNAPSGGSATVNASFFTEGCTSCLGISVQDITNSLTYVAVSGSFSKSGNQVSFNVQVKEMFDLIEGTGSGFTVSGVFVCEE